MSVYRMHTRLSPALRELEKHDSRQAELLSNFLPVLLLSQVCAPAALMQSQLPQQFCSHSNSSSTSGAAIAEAIVNQ